MHAFRFNEKEKKKKLQFHPPSRVLPSKGVKKGGNLGRLARPTTFEAGEINSSTVDSSFVHVSRCSALAIRTRLLLLQGWSYLKRGHISREGTSNKPHHTGQPAAE